MTEQLITFETAKLAKELGFTWECIHFYNKKGELEDRYESSGSSTDTNVPIYLYEFYDNYNSKGWLGVECSAPTQAHLQKWFREVHSLHIVVDVTIDTEWYFTVYNLKDKRNAEIQTPAKSYETYEEALNNAFIKTFKILKK